jgi:hypothetical protein
VIASALQGCPYTDSNPAIHPSSVAAQLGLTREEIQGVLEDQEEWMRGEYGQEQGEDGHTMAEETHQQHQGQDDDTGAQTAPPPLGYAYGMAYNTTDEYNKPVVPFNGCESDANSANDEPDRETMIERLTFETTASGDASENWAEELERPFEFAIQGEYVPSNYSPTPAPPSPIPWHQPPPPTLLYTPPRIHYPPASV